MENFRISIIIPVYNVAAYVLECLQSVAAQNYSNLECVIVNDASPDNSMQIVEDFVKNYRGPIDFKCCYHEENRGLSAARNTGVKASTGDYLFFLDSDDELLPMAIERFTSLLAKYPDVDFIVGGIRVTGSNVKYQLTSAEFLDGKQVVQKSYLRGEWYEMAWNKLINRHFFTTHSLWFYEGIVHEDQLFSFLLALSASSMATLYEATYLYKIRTTGSITSQIAAKSYESYCCILISMLEYVRQSTQLTDLCFSSEQCIRLAYSISLDLYHNLTLSVEEQTYFAIRMSECMKKLKSLIGYNHCPISHKSRICLYVLAGMPVYLSKIVLNIHYNMYHKNKK